MPEMAPHISVAPPRLKLLHLICKMEEAFVSTLMLLGAEASRSEAITQVVSLLPASEIIQAPRLPSLFMRIAVITKIAAVRRIRLMSAVRNAAMTTSLLFR